MEVYQYFLSHVVEIAPKTRRVVKVLQKIPPIVILSDREKNAENLEESADLDLLKWPGLFGTVTLTEVTN